jgi:hypothetical protein
MVAAASAEDGRRRPGIRRPRRTTAAERALAAQLVAAEEFRGSRVCRACALRVVGQMVLVAVEAAEQELRASIKEQTQCPN